MFVEAVHRLEIIDIRSIGTASTPFSCSQSRADECPGGHRIGGVTWRSGPRPCSPVTDRGLTVREQTLCADCALMTKRPQSLTLFTEVTKVGVSGVIWLKMLARSGRQLRG